MAMDGCGNFIKYTFGFVNLIILVGGAVLLGIGISGLTGGKSYVEDLISTELYQGTAIILCVAGSIIIVISFLGCCGAFQENKCLLGMFFCLVLVMFILTGAATVAGFVMGTEKVVHEIESDLQKALEDYIKGDTAVITSFDWIQQHFECCGVDSFEDWKSDIPKSCYKNNQKIGELFKRGCVAQVENFIKDNSKVFGGVTIGVLIFLFVSMILSCTIMKSSH